MSTIGLVTCQNVLEHARSEENPLVTQDDMHLVVALESRGHTVVPLPWEEPIPASHAFDGVVVRSPWNYQDNTPAFLHWLQGLEDKGIPLANNLSTLQWNIDKRYLLELAEKGLPSIPTILLLPEDRTPLEQLMQEQGWTQAIVKPVVGAGAKNNFRLSIEHVADFENKTFQDLRAVEPYLLQPFVKEVLTEGEWSLTFLGGEYSHAALKKARKGDYRVQDDHGGTTHSVMASEKLIQQARKVLETVDRELLYARVDGIEVEGEFRLIEVELIEPELFLRMDPQAGMRFAVAIENWLQAL